MRQKRDLRISAFRRRAHDGVRREENVVDTADEQEGRAVSVQDGFVVPEADRLSPAVLKVRSELVQRARVGERPVDGYGKGITVVVGGGETGEKAPVRDARDADFGLVHRGEGWNLIHLMPSNMAKAAKDLKAKKIMTVHHSKYALAKHPWNEPLTNEKKMQEQDSLNMMIPEIGEVMPL